MSNFKDTDVSISDDLVSKGLQQKITTLVQGAIWQYGWRSNIRRDRFCYWHASFAGGDMESQLNCETELQEKSHLSPILELWKILEAGPLKDHEPVRVYANSHTYGVEGYVHIDNENIENYFSTIYYAHPTWHKNWSGDTVFFTDNGQDIIRSVYPRPGRIVTFNGKIPHCARAPSRDCVELRISVVIKTKIKK